MSRRFPTRSHSSRRRFAALRQDIGSEAADLTEVCTAAIDLFGVQTHGDVATRMSEAMRDADAQVRDSALQLPVQAGIDLFGVKVHLAGPPSKRPDERALFERVVETLVGVAQRTPLLVIFDEFQSLTAVEGATAVLRTQVLEAVPAASSLPARLQRAASRLNAEVASTCSAVPSPLPDRVEWSGLGARAHSDSLPPTRHRSSRLSPDSRSA